MQRLLVLTALIVALAAHAQPPISDAQVRSLIVDPARFDELKSLGPPVLPVLASIYETADADDRALIAGIFYQLGWKSDAAKRVMMRDVHTENPQLRLQVQWALGRVSSDDDVVDVLLANMQNDDNPLFRDKAGCALAND